MRNPEETSSKRSIECWSFINPRQASLRNPSPRSCVGEKIGVGEWKTWQVSAGDGELACIFPVETIGRPIISRDSTAWGTSGKICFFMIVRTSLSPTNHHKVWESEILNRSKVSKPVFFWWKEGLLKLTNKMHGFVVEAATSATRSPWDQIIWTQRCRAVALLPSLCHSRGDGCLWSSRDIPVLLGIGIFPWHYRASGDGLEAMK